MTNSLPSAARRELIGRLKRRREQIRRLSRIDPAQFRRWLLLDSDDGKPLSKVYVKVYAQMKDGRVEFYKDGYTDDRGRFDYTSLNTNELDFTAKFSLLVLSDGRGAVVKEAGPPKR